MGLLGRRAALVGLVLLASIVLCTLLVDVVSSRDPVDIDLDRSLMPPSWGHPFGTDAFGRDIFARAFHGARISLGVGFLARTISLVLGLVLGVISGYFGGRLDSVIMRLADITFAFPTLLLLIAIMAVVSPGLVSLFVALGIVGWAAMARLVRAQVLSIKERDYVQAARSSGANHPAIILRHILPGCVSPVLVVYTMGLGMTVMAEASLSFLGLGVQPPSASWGRMISSGIVFMRTAPWLTLFPGLLLTITVCSLNLIGDGMRDALDPRAAPVPKSVE
jgi:peptide/nickel transport system permease protein